MTSSSKALILLLACLLACSFANARQVTTLTTQNFDSLTAEGKWIIDFFAPWCPHCQQLEPIFEEAAIKVAKTVAGVRFGTIDCTEESALAERFNIEAYPSIKYYRKGAVSDYEGGREAIDFLNFAKQVTSPPVAKVKEDKDLNKLRTSPVSFVLFYKSEDDLKAYTTIAEKYQDSIRFGATKDARLLKVLPENSKSAIVWFNDGDAEVFQVESKTIDVVEAEKWVLARKYPHFIQYDANSWKYFSSLGKPLVVGVIPDTATPSSSPLWKTLQQISLRNKDFVFGRLDGKRYETFVTTYMDGETGQNFFVIEPTKQVYWFNASIGANLEKVETHLNAITSGDLVGKTAATSIFHQFGNFLTSIFGDVLEEPLILALVVIVFIIIVIVAVWFLSMPGTEENQIPPNASKLHSTTTKKPAVNVTIEKPTTEGANRPNKVKKD